MERHVWGYWDCPYCGTKGIRGDNKKCTYCGIQIPPNIRYYMKEDVIEEVAQDQLDDDAHWICEYCDTQNQAWADRCFNCGSPRNEARRDYFGNGINGHPAYAPQPQQSVPAASGSGKSFFKRFKGSIIGGIVLLLVIWLFSPVTRYATVSGFEWERSIAIEEFRNVDESDWNLPSNAHLHSSKQEIKSYRQVLDHYETRTRKVAKRVQDGYDTDYRDLGNGQFKEVRTPRYKTEYKTETYKEPVYRNEPVYATKYYYDIDKWTEVGSSPSSGSGREPYWNEPEVKGNTADPSYGDRREGKRTEEYYAVFVTKDGSEQRIKYSYDDWMKLSEGDRISYKTSRFSDKPID